MVFHVIFPLKQVSHRAVANVDKAKGTACREGRPSGCEKNGAGAAQQLKG